MSDKKPDYRINFYKFGTSDYYLKASDVLDYLKYRQNGYEDFQDVERMTVNELYNAFDGAHKQVLGSEIIREIQIENSLNKALEEQKKETFRNVSENQKAFQCIPKDLIDELKDTLKVYYNRDISDNDIIFYFSILYPEGTKGKSEDDLIEEFLFGYEMAMDDLARENDEKYLDSNQKQSDNQSKDLQQSYWEREWNKVIDLLFGVSKKKDIENGKKEDGNKSET